MTDVPRNRVTWFQIPAPDLQRALALYRSVFGWEPEDAVEDVKMTGAINGGIAERIACLQQPRLIIRVDDVDAVVGNVIEAGGEQVAAAQLMSRRCCITRDSMDPELDLVVHSAHQLLDRLFNGLEIRPSPRLVSRGAARSARRSCTSGWWSPRTRLVMSRAAV